MTIFKLPDLGEGLAEAEIREWYVKVGDTVKVDQPLVSMETAKAVVDVPSPYAGKITELHGKVNDVIKTGAPLISYESNEAVKDKGSVVGKLEQSEKKWDDGAVIIGTPETKTVSIKAMPAARVLANEMNIDLSAIAGTGPKGLITVNDVKQKIAKKTTSVQLEGDTEALHGVRRFMAQAMMQSHQEIVPVTIFEDANISHFDKKTDLTTKLIVAIAMAAKTEPALNAWFDGASLARKLFEEVNMGIAVDTKDGLFVPVIKNVAMLSEEKIRAQLDTFKITVNDRSIAPSEMQGATITLSNFGTFSGQYATPIIVPPAVAIIACGRSREAALVKDGKIIAGRILPLSLTFDHRAVTGGEASRFLGAVISNLEGRGA